MSLRKVPRQRRGTTKQSLIQAGALWLAGFIRHAFPVRRTHIGLAKSITAKQRIPKRMKNKLNLLKKDPYKMPLIAGWEYALGTKKS
jgi:hypothetical protein